MEIYVVKQGDSVYSIAASYGITEEALVYANQLNPPYQLPVGQALLVPSGVVEGGEQAVEVNGYAYPYINTETLNQTLPYLSKISVFSYGFTAEGDLLPPKIDDTFLIQSAKSFGVAPVITVTPLDADGRFNNYLITQLTNNQQVQENFLAQLETTVQEKGFQGVDIDFEYILPQDRVPYAEFVANVRKRINALGYKVSVALAPKTSDSQMGLLYEGKDYALLGEAADQVLLMTYEWGYTYGPPMAVAPINQVRRVVEYALTKIPREKVHLGIPNYGYDWKLPFVRGESKAVVIGNVQAPQIAVQNNAEIQFDEIAQSPFFRYYKGGTEHEVWFEDVRSMQAKFGLVKEYGLPGMGYWQLMRLFRANWLLLADTFEIERG